MIFLSSKSKISKKILNKMGILSLIGFILLIFCLYNFNNSMKIYIRSNDLDKAQIILNSINISLSKIEIETLTALSGMVVNDQEKVQRSITAIHNDNNSLELLFPKIISLLPQYSLDLKSIDNLRNKIYLNAIEIIKKAKQEGPEIQFLKIENQIGIYIFQSFELISGINNSLSLINSKSTNNAKLNFTKTKWIILISFFVSFFIITILSSFFVRLKIVNPLTLLKQGASKISDGDLKQRIQLQTKDEFEDLANQFNLMAHQLNEVYQGLENKIQDRTKELVEANKHKSNFLASMSHELRTPLNAIIGFSEVLEQEMFGEVNAKQREYLIDILNSGRHLLSLINDILDLSKVEAGKMELHLSTLDFQDTIKQAISIVAERAKNSEIKIIFNFTNEMDLYYGDERKLKQIMLNLLSNAIKFTPKGGHITVDINRQNNDYRVSVKDTGIGIAKEDQKKIFAEFSQVGTDVTRKAEGTGLGLALTLKFVELHGGKIWFESELNKGTTFIFTLPVTKEVTIEDVLSGN